MKVQFLNAFNALPTELKIVLVGTLIVLNTVLFLIAAWSMQNDHILN